MRKSEREIATPAGIAAVLDRCTVLRLALRTGGAPYIVPLSFGYRHDGADFTFYFHCANEGRKLDLLRADPVVGFELDGPQELIHAERACRYSLYYESVVGEGRASVVDDVEEKREALRLLMLRQTGEDICFDEAQARGVTVCRIDATVITGKAHRPA